MKKYFDFDRHVYMGEVVEISYNDIDEGGGSFYLCCGYEYSFDRPLNQRFDFDLLPVSLRRKLQIGDNVLVYVINFRDGVRKWYGVKL